MRIKTEDLCYRLSILVMQRKKFLFCILSDIEKAELKTFNREIKKVKRAIKKRQRKLEGF